jgi:hypothetical protein
VSRERGRNFAWAADGLVLLALAAALRGPTIGLAEIDWDESNFTLVARAILGGHWPYTAVFEHKPIALYLHYAAALALFGDTPISVRLLGIATAAASAFLVRTIALDRLDLGRWWGLLLGGCYVLLTIGFDGQPVYSEHLVNLYLLLSALLLPARRWTGLLLSGCAAGVAINVNYLAVPVLGGIVAGYLATLVLEGRLRTALLSACPFVAGAIVTTALLLLPVALFAGVAQYFAAQFDFLSGYAASAPLAVRLVAAATLAAPLLPIAAVAAALAWSRRASVADAGAAASMDYPILFAGALAGSVLAVLVSGYLFDHYMLLCLPWALLLVASLAAGTREDLQALSGAVLAGTSLMIALPGMLVAGTGAHNLLIEARTGAVRDEPRRLAEVARPIAPEGSSIYVLCAPIVLYQLLHARPATRYPFYPFALNPKYASALGLDVDREISAILASRPSLIIVGDSDKCGDIPEASWEKVRDAVPRSGYIATKRFEGYTLFAPPLAAGTAATR